MNKLVYRIYLFVLTVFFVACSNEDADIDRPQSGEEVSVHFSLSTRATSGTPANPVEALQVERFNHYWVVFTDGTAANKIVAIVNNNCSLTERDEFTVTLSPGAYKVYAFANIADSYLASLNIVEGQGMPDLSGVLFTPDNRFFGNSVTKLLPAETFQSDYASNGNQGIPMTSVNGINVNITNAVTVTTSIEVVRMFAKLEFVFTNETGKALTLRSQQVSNLSVNLANETGYIPLYNDDNRNFDFLSNKPYKTLSHEYGEGGLALANDPSLKKSQAFYVLESKADELTNSFMLDFDVYETGKTPDANTPEEDHMRYGLTDPNTLTTIRRNDWIRIPITFADWQMRLEAHTYPPIGGYPEAEIEETESNEFVVKFDGGGDFSIRPFVQKFSDGEEWFGIDNTEKVVISQVAGSESPKITVDDPNGIFTTTPKLTTTGEIRGRMAVASGKTACITIKVDVKTSESVTKTLTRKIFVTQK